MSWLYTSKLYNMRTLQRNNIWKTKHPDIGLLYVFTSHKRISNMNQSDRNEPKHCETEPLTESHGIFFFIIVYPYPYRVRNYCSYHNDHDETNKEIIHGRSDQVTKSKYSRLEWCHLGRSARWCNHSSCHIVRGKQPRAEIKLKWNILHSKVRHGLISHRETGNEMRNVAAVFRKTIMPTFSGYAHMGRRL